jgi:hypothetical protein
MIKLSLRKARLGATTLVETAIAACLVAGFFATIYEVNAVCFRYIDASKESVAALQGVQDRIEGLRGLSFANLTSTSTMQTTLASPANSSDFVSKVQEVVTVSGYPSGTPTVTYTRPSGASSTVSASPSSPDFSSTTLVKVNVSYTWTMTFGGRARSEQTETIIAAGNKKA